MRQIYYRVCLFLGIYKREDFVTAHEVVEYALVHYPIQPERWVGICVMLCNALFFVAKVTAHYSKVQKYLGILDPNFFGLPSKLNDTYDYWWSTKDSEAKYIRLKALRKMLDYYAEHEVLIKKGKAL